MNLIQPARVALAAAVLAGGALGPSAAPTFADSAGLQPTQIVFTSTSSTLDRAKAFTTPGTPVAFSGLVSPNATGTVKMFDSVWDGTTVQTGPIATVPTCPGGVPSCPAGRFVVVIPATSLSAGVHLLTAVYLGDDHFAPSSSPVFTEVNQADTYPQYFQPTHIAFTSPSATQDPAKAFNSAGAPLSFNGVVSPNASGTVVMFDSEPDGVDAIALAVVPVTDGQFSVTINTNGNNGISIPQNAPTSLGNGTHLLTALYLGHDGVAPSSSPVFTEVITGPGY
jgi:hypothetical protein